MSPLNIPNNATADIMGPKMPESVSSVFQVVPGEASHSRTQSRAVCVLFSHTMCCSLKCTELEPGQGFRSRVSTAGMPMVQSEARS